MGLIAQVVREATGAAGNVSRYAPTVVTPFMAGRPQSMPANVEGYIREGYSGNEIVYSCIELRANTASEPKIHAKVGGKWTLEESEAPILTLLRYPNPWMEGFEFFANVIMHLDIAGNAFALKERSASGKPVDLWLLRPDQVKIVPDPNRYISHYELDLGSGDSLRIPVEDIIHWKTRNPRGWFYGLSPMMAASGRIDIDNYMTTFVKAYFENAGVPGGVLAIDGDLDDADRQELKERAQRSASGPDGWHSWLILNHKATFTPITNNLGSSGLVVPELEKATSRRLCAVYGVPGALVGVNEDNTSYASLNVIERHWWNQLRQLYKRLEAPLNSGPKKYQSQPQTGITQDFFGVEEVGFDMSEVRALQEDVDTIHERVRKDVVNTVATIEEARTKAGYGEVPEDGTFLVPSNMVAVPAGAVKAGRIEMQAAPAPVGAGDVAGTAA